jgi:acyl-CoA reductase-like NAD-dependent aldehyde dehydrogenase
MGLETTQGGTPLGPATDRFAAIVGHRWKMLIGGELREAGSGQSMSAIHPGDGSVVGSFPSGDRADVSDAVTTAQSASAGWASTAIAERAHSLFALAYVVERHGEELAWIDTIDNGSPIAVMRNDFVSPCNYEVRRFRFRPTMRSTSRYASPSALSVGSCLLTIR